MSQRYNALRVTPDMEHARAAQSVSLLSTSHNDELLLPGLLGKVSLEVLCFEFAGGNPRQTDVTFFSDEDAKSKRLALNRVLNETLAQIAPEAEFAIRGPCVICFVDFERGGGCCADMPRGGDALQQLVRGILAAQAARVCERTVPYVITRVTAHMRDVGSEPCDHLRTMLLQGVHEIKTTPSAWLSQFRAQEGSLSARALAVKRVRTVLQDWITGKDGFFVSRHGQDIPSDAEWADLLDAACDIMQEA